MNNYILYRQLDFCKNMANIVQSQNNYSVHTCTITQHCYYIYCLTKVMLSVLNYCTLCTHFHLISSIPFLLPSQLGQVPEVSVATDSPAVVSDIVQGPPSDEVTDLRQRLTILQQKRADDKGRIKELEKYKAQFMQVSSITAVVIIMITV